MLMKWKEYDMMKYIYEFYLRCGISPAMITAVVHALIGTGVIFAVVILQRIFMISQELKSISYNGESEQQWHETVDEVIRKHQIKHADLLIAVTYVTLLMANYFIIMR
jgi:hypothetical protein